MTSDDIERITQAGEPARRLLDNPDFVGVLNALSDFHLAEIVASSPGDVGRAHREHHHLMLCALKEIHADCIDRVTRLEALEAELAELDEPLNEQEDDQ